MTTALWITNVALCVLVLGLGFLVFGTLRALGVLTWRLDQLQATTPRRIGRDGLPVGRPAPDFTLSDVHQRDVSLHEYRGRQVLLVFTQSGCGPCHDIVPDLNRLHDRGGHTIIGINNGPLDETAEWVAETGARFPVLTQDELRISKQFEVFATPYAFLLDKQGVIRSKGIISTRQHIGYVLSATGQTRHGRAAATEVPSGTTTVPASSRSCPKEAIHV